MADIKLESTGYYKVDPLYQWDLNQTLYIYGVSVVRPVIHFNNKSMVNSIVRQPSIDKLGVISVDIPNSLLQKAEPISVFVCGYEGDTFKTYYKMEIPVKSRKKPADYTLELDDEEVYSFVKLEQTIADALVSYETMYNNANARVTNCEKTVTNCEKTVTNCIVNFNNLVKHVNTYDDTIGTIKNDLNSVRNKKSITLLWENASPLSTFYAQNISIDLSNYRYVLVEYCLNSTLDSGQANKMDLIKVGSSSYASFYWAGVGYERRAKVTSTYVDFGGGATTKNTDHNANIPQYIWGVE